MDTSNQKMYEYELHFISLQNRPAIYNVQAESIETAFDALAKEYKESGLFSDVCIDIEGVLKILAEGQTLCRYVQDNDLVLCEDIFLRNPCYIFQKELEPSKQEEALEDADIEEERED